MRFIEYTLSAYSRAADLGNGIVWYASIAVGAAVLTIAAAVAACLRGTPAAAAFPLALAAILAVLHSLVTTQAVPTNFSQRRVSNDESALAHIFARFARWQVLRVVLQVLNFGALLWALVSYAAGR